MKNVFLGIVVLVISASTVTSSSNGVMYEGTWTVTNRDLNGTMTAVVTRTGTNRWHGHFYGVWQGQAFSYHVDFSGARDNLRGEAEIDGADYRWAAIFDRKGSFRGNFNGTRYNGHFDLKPK